MYNRIGTQIGEQTVLLSTAVSAIGNVYLSFIPTTYLLLIYAVQVSSSPGT